MDDRRHGAGEPGMVTSEFALVTPIYFLMVFIMLSGLVGAWKTIEVTNEAKEIAREYSIDGTSEVASAVRGAGGAVDLKVEGDVVHVSVTREGAGVYDLVGIDFVGHHRAVIEPGARDG